MPENGTMPLPKIKPYVPRMYELKPYKDPLKEKPKEWQIKPYKGEIKHHVYKEYVPSNIDPLTGKPYRTGRYKRPEPKPQPKPTKPVHATYRPFPKELGNPAGTVKRSIKMYQHPNLNF